MADPKASDPVEDTSSQVNLAILSSLERLNEGMAQLTDYMYQGREAEENEDGESLGTGESASVVNIQQDLDRIVKPNDGTEDSREGDDSVLSTYSSLLELDLETKAPKVNDEIADVANKLCLHRVSTDQCKALIKRHLTPEDIKVRLPKCENSIWTQLPAQQMLLAAINCQLEVTNSLVNSKASKELLTSALDGLTLFLTANYEMNQRRRDAIRPQFKAEFAKGLCSATNPADEFLFEGDTSKRMKETIELQKSRVCKSQGTPSTRGRNRFVPYSRGYRRGRGRGARTSTYTSQSGYQQPEVNKKLTKAPNNYWCVNNSKLLDVVNSQKPFVAGRTNQCLSEWVKLTTDPEILDIVKHCHIEFSKDPCLFSFHGQRNFNSGQQAIVNEEVDKLLEFLVSKETVVLRRWERSKQKFGFIKRVDKG